MCPHNHRVLVENGISPVEWAILSVTSYFLPALPNQLVIQAQLESEDDFSTDELKIAGVNCGRRGWKPVNAPVAGLLEIAVTPRATITIHLSPARGTSLDAENGF